MTVKQDTNNNIPLLRPLDAYTDLLVRPPTQMKTSTPFFL